MTLRQIAIRIALLVVVFLVLVGMLRYAFEEEAPYLAAGACVLVGIVEVFHWRWWRSLFE